MLVGSLSDPAAFDVSWCVGEKSVFAPYMHQWPHATDLNKNPSKEISRPCNASATEHTVLHKGHSENGCAFRSAGIFAYMK